MSRIGTICIIATTIALITIVIASIAIAYMNQSKIQPPYVRLDTNKTSLCSLGIHSGYLIANAEEFLCYFNRKDAACKGKANNRYGWEYELNLYLLRKQVIKLNLSESTIVNIALIYNRGVPAGKSYLSQMISRFTDEIKYKYGLQAVPYYTQFYDIEVRCNAGIYSNGRDNAEIKAIHDSILEFRNYHEAADSFVIEANKGRRYACRQLEQRIISSIESTNSNKNNN